jgi:hypothetical protein
MGKRKPNFTDHEKVRLIEEYEQKKYILVGKFAPNVSSRKKHKAWVEICDSLNSCNPKVSRTVDDLQKKWQNLVTVMKEDYRAYRNGLQKTGTCQIIS